METTHDGPETMSLSAQCCALANITYPYKRKLPRFRTCAELALLWGPAATASSCTASATTEAPGFPMIP